MYGINELVGISEYVLNMKYYIILCINCLSLSLIFMSMYLLVIFNLIFYFIKKTIVIIFFNHRNQK